MPRVTLLVLFDGRRECMMKCMNSLRDMVDYPWYRRVMVNDSGDAQDAIWLDERYPHFIRIHNDRRRGFREAIRTGWRQITDDTEYVFQVEQDFVFNAPVNVNDLEHLLSCCPSLAQVALLRGPVSSDEVSAGGVFQNRPGEFVQEFNAGIPYVRHQSYFTTNPSLYPKWVVDQGWPDIESSEEAFSKRILVNGVGAAYWGRLGDSPMVMHIGDQRIGFGY